MSKTRLKIIGIVGVPGSYGGFETLAEHLIRQLSDHDVTISVYCEKSCYVKQNGEFLGARLISMPFRANGAQSIVFDIASIIRASLTGGNVLILGTSGTLILPIAKMLFPKVNYIVNMAGLEWTRSKWGWLARKILKLNEKMAVKHADVLIVDNQGLKDYIAATYRAPSVLIAYGGDQYEDITPISRNILPFDVPEQFDFAMARCQPDNNMEIIIDSYVQSRRDLVFVSNWSSNNYGRVLLSKYKAYANIRLVGPFYDKRVIKCLFNNAQFYVHGHSAGGTNPVLVEAMWNKKAIVAFDVCFNRHTTFERAAYFKDSQDIERCIENMLYTEKKSGSEMYNLAKEHYSWSKIAAAYARLFS